ncbi:hypothetical protein EKO27_g6394 [Xylaria grammica]|uniref:non-specific serine/threonine protein kinase n=1 Tax=Xylaria grammica TaxID=363999 RepID=A0A439D2W3_9PEZI|nr:hypothetical protein EKO27_g6394 [Xylaria grammica]
MPQKTIGPVSFLQDLPKDEFHKHVNHYRGYIRGSHKKFGRDLFRGTTDEVKKEGYMTKKQVLDVDKWMQKRGARKNRKETEEGIEQIEGNESTIKEISRCAFKTYQNNSTATHAERAWKAMQILMNLKGVRESMACLLLSVAFPETVPYCSEVLFRWTQGAQNDDDVSPEEEEEKYYISMFTRVDEIRHRYGEAVTAIDVEKAAFVMQCNSDMEESRKPEITQTLLGAQCVKGEGGYGTVYEVDPSHFKDIRTNADAIAVKKIMLRENSTDEEALQRRRILTEILVSSRLAGLSDEHFVRFLGWNEDVEEKCYYIAMDWVRYGDLERNLRCPGEPEWKWSETAMKSVVEQILQGLGFMHKERIAHRDLKPQIQNILVYSLTSPQGEVRIKIADFGVSKRVHTTTIFKTIAGTQGYKAPEVVKAWDDEGHDSDHRYDYNVDIWSLGDGFRTPGKCVYVGKH